MNDECGDFVAGGRDGGLQKAGGRIGVRSIPVERGVSPRSRAVVIVVAVVDVSDGMDPR